MFQARLDFDDGTHVIYTILRKGEEYSMVRELDGELVIEPCRFGGSKHGLVADDEGSLVTRSIHPTHGGIRDFEAYIDHGDEWEWLFSRLNPDTPPVMKPTVTLTVKDGKPLAPSDPMD
jgi:hypothetical protein